MKILLIGATGFIGPYLVGKLASGGHELAVFHRRKSPGSLPASVQHILGDRNTLAEHLDQFRRFGPEVVIDLILSSGPQASTLMTAFRGLTQRVVALSSGDVYRAAGILHGFELGPLEPMPLTEDSNLRTKRNVYGPEVLTRLRSVFPWLGEDYDKIPVEEAVMSDRELPGTVLRLPMVYGPGDPLDRLFPYLKRMDDRRPAILLQEDAAHWRGPRGYVENVAAAIALAAVSPHAIGRIYNIAEQNSYPESEWVQKIGRAAKWNGDVVPIAKDLTPAHLRIPYNSQQHWEMSSKRIRKELGFAEPVAESTGLERTIAWERANPPSWNPAQFDYGTEDEAIRAAKGAQL
ncbi:MAG: NAD-dependent epimerase/dehydratase family protein [Acidobacteriota bacterium]|nr:NAD-dependent epimerase/dehydratase family protein [Acidobacteriota bacterium]